MRANIVFSLLLALSALSAFAAPAQAALDTNHIHTLYLEGDFERATRMLETALKDGRVRTHADSVFAFKHLGVMFAADNNSREKGKYYMLNLVTIEPTARIMDMYASDMIYMIFKNIQEEYEATRGRLLRAERHVAGNQGRAEDAPTPQPAAPAHAAPAPQAEAKAGSRKTRNYLLAGGAVALLVGAGVAAHIILDEEPTAGTQVNDINR